MLAERVDDWTQSWKQQGLEEGRREGFREGFQEGLQQGLQEVLRQVREILVQKLEERFGSLPGSVLSRLESIDSIKALSELIGRVPQAHSLAEFGL